METKKLHWKFPLEQTFFIRIELLFVAFLAVLIFVGTLFFYEQQFTYPVIYTCLFLILYALAAVAIRKVRQTESQYQVHKKGIEIKHKVGGRTTTAKVPLHHVAQHKVDKHFLGGYVVTHQGKKHQLFFNTGKEVEAFRKFMKKHHP